MKSLIYHGLCVLILVCPLVALHAQEAARTVKYSETDIIPIRAKVRFSTLIVLPADEEILDFTTGDKDFWIINGTHNLCYLHPAQTGIRSNMNLVTASGHVYSFLLTEISKESDGEPDLKVFVTPNDQSSVAGNLKPARYIRASEVEAYKEEVTQLRNQVTQDSQRAQAQATRQVDEFKRNYPAKLQFDYKIDKKAQLAPFLVSAIYHDDSFTYLKSAAREKPTIYEIKDKKPNLVNFSLEDGLYVVPKIIDSGYLVVGKKRVTFDRRGN
jgi:type IV secretory pathway VirB9-like protein